MASKIYELRQRTNKELMSEMGEWIDVSFGGVCLDGNFTAAQLRRIADCIDELDKQFAEENNEKRS